MRALVSGLVSFCFLALSMVGAASGADQPVITPPAGFGHYCSLKDGAFGYGNLNSDPCGTAAVSSIAYAGLWNINGVNRAYLECDDGYKAAFMSPVAGKASLQAAFDATTGHPGCKINVAPKELPVFRFPWLAKSQLWMNTHRGVDLALHRQTYTNPQLCRGDSAGSHHALDNAGHVDWHALDEDSNHSGYDWSIPNDKPGDWGVRAVAAGKVILARARPCGCTDGVDGCKCVTPQNEVYIRHVVAKSRTSIYREEFISYYAHLKSIGVSAGQVLDSNQLIGPVGDTGHGKNTHLHLSVFRLRNVRGAWKSYFPFGTEDQVTPNFNHDEVAEFRSVDPFGWNSASCVDAWGFHSDSSRGAPSINLWKSGLAPPGWNHSGHQ